LGGSQGLKLGRGGQQFQFGGDDLFHERSIADFTRSIKIRSCMNRPSPPKPHIRTAAFLPTD
jgi:hypothetical protein